MNINQKIIQLGVGLWEQKISEGMDKEKFQQEFEEAFGEMNECRQLVLDLTPHQKSILLFMIMTQLAILASCHEDQDSAAPVVAATIIQLVDKFLDEDLKSGRLKMPMAFPDLIGMCLMFPQSNLLTEEKPNEK